MIKFYFLSSLLVAWYVTGASCEEQLIEPDTRIVGGQDAPDDKFPYQVSLRRTVGSEFHFCGGSIVRPKWVLTAAHCTIRRKPNEITVVVGSILLSSGGSRHKVDKIINHENYNASNLERDISLLKLVSELSFDSKVAPIALSEKDTPDGTKCILSGWGYINNNQKTTNKLQMLNQTTYPLKQCRERLIRYSRRYPITEKQVCAYSGSSGKGGCQGDSGGPLACDNKLVGVVSWGYPCATGRPDVYTKVFAFLDWIKDKIDA